MGLHTLGIREVCNNSNSPGILMSLCSSALRWEKKILSKIIIIIMDPEYKIVYRYGDNADTKFRLS